MLFRFAGYEAIVFLGDQVYLTIEVEGEKHMSAYIVSGVIDPELSAIRLDEKTLRSIPMPANLNNKSDESLLVIDQNILALYEVNGHTLFKSGVQKPWAVQFDPQLTKSRLLPFPALEFRVTDACQPDANGKFWVMNYFYPIERQLYTDHDPLMMQYGAGATHVNGLAVERLVELQYTSEGIIQTGRPPIQLQLTGDRQPRNWEGLVRLDERGFLIVTDKYPTTILAFVPFTQTN